MKDIDETKAPLMEHLVELRRRLLRSLAALAVAFFACLYFARDIFAVLVQPLLEAGQGKLIYTDVFEAFFVEIKVALFAALMITFPVIATQLWKFVAPGLYEHERRYSLPFLIISTILFLLGAVFAYLVMLPIALHFLIAQGGELWEPNITLSNYLSFCMRLILAAGLIFEFPVLMYFLAKVGVVTPEFLVRNRKYAVLAAFVISGALCGLAGALLANHTAYIAPAFMDWTRSGEIMFMVILGGMGSLPGPALGAFALLIVEDLLAGWTEHWQVILGPLLVLSVLFFRRGLAGLLPGGDRNG